MDDSREEKNKRWYIKVADIADFSVNPPVIHYFAGKDYQNKIKNIKMIIEEVENIPGLTETERETITKSRV